MAITVDIFFSEKEFLDVDPNSLEEKFYFHSSEDFEVLPREGDFICLDGQGVDELNKVEKVIHFSGPYRTYMILSTIKKKMIFKNNTFDQ
jgi:hypothetical protein